MEWTSIELFDCWGPLHGTWDDDLSESSAYLTFRVTAQVLGTCHCSVSCKKKLWGAKRTQTSLSWSNVSVFLKPTHLPQWILQRIPISFSPVIWIHRPTSDPVVQVGRWGVGTSTGDLNLGLTCGFKAAILASSMQWPHPFAPSSPSLPSHHLLFYQWVSLTIRMCLSFSPSVPSLIINPSLGALLIGVVFSAV